MASGEVQLLFVRKVIGDRWEFKTKPHARFDAFLEHLLTRGLYSTKKVRPLRGSGIYVLSDYYEISDEGMWLLRPHFANWDEMEAAGSRGRSGFERARCSVCGKDDDEEGAIFLQCRCCEKWYCGPCFMKHQQEKNTYRCDFCHDTYAEESINRCSSCGMYYCSHCVAAHHSIEHMTFRFTYVNEEPRRFTMDDFARTFEYARYKPLFGGFGAQATSGTAVPPVLPSAIREACTLLGLATTAKPTLEAIRGAFRAKVRQAADGKGGYIGDMDALTKAKEQLVAFVKG